MPIGVDILGVKFRTTIITVVAILLAAMALAAYDHLTAPAEVSFEHAPLVQGDASGVMPVAIKAADLNIAVPLELGSITNDEWVLSDEAANYLDVSGKIGESGNIVIYGHDKKSIFGNFKEAQTGQVVHLTGSDGQEREYTITNIFETTPENVDVIQPTEHELLTIYTCTGWRNSKRLIVQAEPI